MVRIISSSDMFSVLISRKPRWRTSITFSELEGDGETLLTSNEVRVPKES